MVGGLLGELASKVDWLWWLSYNQVFGLENPIVLDLSVVKITFALMFKISISSIIGMVLAIFIYKKYKRQNRGNLDKKGMEYFVHKMKELPKSERPYEKLELYGEKTLSNAELLAIIIKTGTKDETSVELAQRILKLNDTDTEDLSYLQALSIEELMQIKGIGKVKAIQLKAVTEIAIRMFKTSNYKAITIKQPHDLAKILMSELKFEKVKK